METNVNVDDLADYESEEDETTLITGTEKTNRDTHIATHGTGFDSLMLRPEILRAIGDCGFEHPSEVQYQCIPQAIVGTDVLCQAKSGMGKTAVFVISSLNQLENIETLDNVVTLVLVPTRELALQVQKEYERIKKYITQVRTLAIIGGKPIVQDRKALQNAKPHILVGTPSRIFQLVQEKTLNLSGLKQFILDECDMMLENLDMRREVQGIFKSTPHNKQVMMFTATLTEGSRGICKRFMYQPHEIYINEGSKLTLHGLQQYFVSLPENQKNRKLVDLLDNLKFTQVVIFVSGVPRASVLNKLLVTECFPSVASYGPLRQKKRLEIYEAFKTNKKPILISTDIFARGVDFERVNVVINYDMPDSEDTYLHRVGRAGRFGTKGLAISFVTSDTDKEVLEKIRSKFVVKLPELPANIDPSSYGTA